MLKSTVLAAIVLCAAFAPRLAAADELVIGASLPLSGALASFGAFQRWGYERAVAEANKAGGIVVGGSHATVRLVVRDDRTDANVSASNIETLISRDHATALLGSCTPALVNAGALVAERHRVPMVTACDPRLAFTSVRAWKYVWDLFFDEAELAEAPFRALADAGVVTNKKIAILHDNGPDGQVVGGQLWPALAQKYGWTVVVSASFPVDSTQFTSIIADAKAKSADVVLVDAITPQAVSIRKQFATAGYRPKVLVIEKGAEPAQFGATLGSLADGVLVGGYWDPSFPYPGARDLMAAYEQESRQPGSQHIADSYAAAKVLLAAIAAAGNSGAEPINAAIGKTDASFVVGPVKFDAQHFARLPIASVQWQKNKTVVVWPAKLATGKLLFPLP
jgi:branched-chain amino acid transport system substrate-binding protein